MPMPPKSKRKTNINYKKLNPQLILMDATYALDGHGPMYGEAKRLDMIFSSNNPIATDSLGTVVMGIPIKNAEHILIAEKEGLCITDLEKIKINNDWREYKMQFYLYNTFLDNLLNLLFESEIMASLVTDSLATLLIYEMAKHLQNSNEQDVVNEMGYCK